jgi:hypothetical protein
MERNADVTLEFCFIEKSLDWELQASALEGDRCKINACWEGTAA